MKKHLLRFWEGIKMLLTVFALSGALAGSIYLFIKAVEKFPQTFIVLFILGMIYWAGWIEEKNGPKRS